MPQLTHEQMAKVERGEVVPVKSNIDAYNSAGKGPSGTVTVNFDPSYEQVQRLRCGESVLYETDAIIYGPAGGNRGSGHVRFYPPDGD